MSTDVKLQEKYSLLLPHLDEKTARLYLASEAQSMGRGGKAKVALLAGVSRVRINKGLEDLRLATGLSDTITAGSIRKPGAGRKPHYESQPGLVESLQEIVNPHTLGDPMKPLLWTSKSLRHIGEALNKQGYQVGHVTVKELLKSMDYSLQGNKKTQEGGKVADRNEQSLRRSD